MKFTEYKQESKTVLFISGMFAGDWMWRDMHAQIKPNDSIMIHESLGELGAKVETFTKLISNKLDSIEGQVSVVGNSLGGFVALDVAKSNPDKVERVLISGSAGFGEVNLGLKLSRNNVKFIDDLVSLIFYDKNVISTEDKAQIASVFKNKMRNVVGLIKESNLANADQLINEVKCPIHAVWGEDDRITPINDALPLLKSVGAKIDVIPFCGHSPMYEKPDDFAEWLKTSLAN